MLGFASNWVVPKQFKSYGIISNPIAGPNQLYADITYLNSLIENKDTGRLAEIFGISGSEAAKITAFEVEPQINVVNLARSVDNLYSSIDTTIWNADSSDFLENNQDPNLYGSHIVTIYSLDPSLFAKLGTPLITFIEDHEQLRTERERIGKIWNQRRLKLEAKIHKLDSLQDVYANILVLEAQKSNKVASTQINLAANQTNQKIDPVRLIDESEKYQNMLVNLERKLVYFDSYYWVVSSINPKGEPAFLSKRHKSLFGAGAGYLICLIFLLTKFRAKD